MATQIETKPITRKGADDRASQRLPVSEDGPRQRAKPARRGGRLTLALIFLIPLAVVTGLYGYARSQSYQSTDDAFVDGHIINVAPKVAGRVERVLVTDNQRVKKGDVVVVLDGRDFAATRRQKAAALESTRAQAGAVKASIDQAIAHVTTLQATMESDQATADASRAQADKTAKDFRRIQDLFQTKVASAQDLDAARAANDSAQAQLQASLKKVVSDQAQVAEGRATVNAYLGLLQSVQAQTEESDATLQTARLNESYTEIRAPEEGRVTKKSVEPGNYVQTGQTLFALVPADVWVTANYKENQIGRMRPGQPAEITIDALHGQKFRGHIDSIQAGSGARFSLLPPENATGNYVKVVQRIPVKIVFDQLPEVGLPLGPGESVVPTVKVQDFHYSPVVLGVIAVLTLGLVSAAVWFRARPRRSK